MKDYYKTLGVSNNAPAEEIKRAFYRLAHKHHPDKGGDEKKFKEVNEAYQVLGNKEKRAKYDAARKVGFEFGDMGYEGAWSPFGQGFDFGGFDFRDFGMETLEEIMEDIFGSTAFRKTRKRRGRNILIDIELSLEEVLSGTKREIELFKFIICERCKGKGGEPGTKFKTCPSCRGTGLVEEIHRTFLGTFTRTNTCPQCQGEGEVFEHPCRQCRGRGKMKEMKKSTLSIPPGISNGETIRTPKEGEAFGRGGEPGDLFVRVHIRPHPTFERRGDDIYSSVEVNFSQAVLGDKIDIPTLDGIVELIIPQGTPAGKLLRLKGMGLPHLQRRGRGDMYAKVNLKIPKRLTKKQKELVKRLKEEGI